MGVTVSFEHRKQITMADNFYQEIGEIDKQHKKQSKNGYQIPGNLHLSKRSVEEEGNRRKDRDRD